MKGRRKQKAGEWRPGRNSGWLQQPDVRVSFNLLEKKENWICFPQMRTININSLGWKSNVVLPSVFSICQSSAVKSSTVQWKKTKKKGTPFCRDFLNGAPTWGRNKRGIVHSCYLLRAGDRKKQLCIRMLTPAPMHWRLVLVLTDGIRRVKGGATEQVNGAAVTGQGTQGKKRVRAIKQEKVMEQRTSNLAPTKLRTRYLKANFYPRNSHG